MSPPGWTKGSRSRRLLKVSSSTGWLGATSRNRPYLGILLECRPLIRLRQRQSLQRVLKLRDSRSSGRCWSSLRVLVQFLPFLNEFKVNFSKQ